MMSLNLDYLHICNINRFSVKVFVTKTETSTLSFKADGGIYVVTYKDSTTYSRLKKTC